MTPPGSPHSTRSSTARCLLNSHQRRTRTPRASPARTQFLHSSSRYPHSYHCLALQDSSVTDTVMLNCCPRSTHLGNSFPAVTPVADSPLRSHLDSPSLAPSHNPAHPG